MSIGKKTYGTRWALCCCNACTTSRLKYIYRIASLMSSSEQNPNWFPYNSVPQSPCLVDQQEVWVRMGIVNLRIGWVMACVVEVHKQVVVHTGLGVKNKWKLLHCLWYFFKLFNELFTCNTIIYVNVNVCIVNIWWLVVS